MAQYPIPNPDDLLECPYDRVHMIRAKRFQYHLIKCRKNYTGKEFERCPFNAKHHIPKPEMRHHLANCRDKAIIEPELNYNQKRDNGDNTLKGCMDTPVYKEIDIPSSEDWEAEASAPVRVGARYDQTYYDRVQFKDLSGMTKSQKAIVTDGRLTAQQKMEELAGGDRQMTDIYVRLPKTASKLAMTSQPQIKPKEQPVSCVFAYSTGRGLAQGVTPGGQPAAVNGGAGTFMPTMPYGRGIGMNSQGQPSKAVGVGRGSVGRGHVAPPPGFCVPKVLQADKGN